MATTLLSRSHQSNAIPPPFREKSGGNPTEKTPLRSSAQNLPPCSEEKRKGGLVVQEGQRAALGGPFPLQRIQNRNTRFHPNCCLGDLIVKRGQLDRDPRPRMVLKNELAPQRGKIPHIFW